MDPVTIPDEPEPPDLDQIKSVWDCVDPCAFLLYSIQINAIPLDKHVYQTLDAFGWLDPEGQPDFDKMNREFQTKTKR